MNDALRQRWYDPHVGAIVEVGSSSTGSLLVDAGIGAAVGYLGAPVVRQRFLWAAMGAGLAGAAGLFGLTALVGILLFKRK